MQYFEKQGNALIFRQDGETVRVEPWQKDSLRVRGTLLSEIEEGSIALLDPEPVEAEIELVDERKATIKNGKIQAVLELQPWGQKLRITFLNQKGEVLLSEIANGGALCLRAHDYRALKGGAYQLKVSFDSNPDEKIYGMGQHHQITEHNKVRHNTRSAACRSTDVQYAEGRNLTMKISHSDSVQNAPATTNTVQTTYIPTSM